jgi:hypothetical protein
VNESLDSSEVLRGLAKIFLPYEIKAKIVAISDDMERVGGASDEEEGIHEAPARPSFRSLTTASSYEGHAIVEKYCRKIKRLAQAGETHTAFLWAFATTYIAREEDFWFQDTDASEQVEKIVKSLYESWQTILGNGDEALGITASDRACVLYMLTDLKETLESLDYKVPAVPT